MSLLCNYAYFCIENIINSKILCCPMEDIIPFHSKNICDCTFVFNFRIYFLMPLIEDSLLDLPSDF